MKGFVRPVGWPSSSAVIRTCVALLAACTLGSCGGSPTAPTPPPGPSLTCPADIDLQSPDDAPVRVTYTAPAAQGGAAPVNVACTPLTDTDFAVGATTVSCTATDGQARTAVCSFTVRVRAAPRLTASRFLAFGDSITFGRISPPVMLFSAGEPHSYPFKLRDLLAMRYPLQTIDIINTGWSGEYASRSGNGSPGGQRRLLTELQLRNPEVLLLMEGSNDLLESDGFETGLAALDRMVQDAKNHGVRVFLATIPPQRAGGIRDRVAQMIPSFNEQVRAIATRQNVVLVDVFAKLEPNIQLFIGVDDLHPTEMGFGAIAEAFFEAIRGNLEPTEISSAHVW